MLYSVIIFFLSLFFMESEKPKVIYVGDPMCSWCYGISNELEKLTIHNADEFEFEIVMGGLRPYNQETMLDLKDFLTEHWQHVNQKSDLAFNYEILNTDIKYDTEPPSRAVVIVRDLKPEKAFHFFKTIQNAFYFENKNLHLVESYKPILESLDIDFDTFAQHFEDQFYKDKVRLDFSKANDLGVRSFPTILLQYNGKYHTIAQGYSSFDKMNARIEKIINN